MSLKLTDDLLTGYELIDIQHKDWLTHFDMLWQGVTNKSSAAQLIEILTLLDNSVAIHFADEEKLQAELSYPCYEIQRRQHESYRAEIKHLMETLEADKSETISSYTLHSMRDWILNHIKVMDKAMVEYCLATGKCKLPAIKNTADKPNYTRKR